ncbi:hypothetical protein MHH37_17225 [Solibacillus sp. FSL K6-1781]|uniref:hypothetical protein n=1 Tax=Solibacillus sp. FSL K6-1781 TaxID=2921474 RepID=UPI00315A4A99
MRSVFFYKIGFNIYEMQFEGSKIELHSSRDTIYEDLANNLECETLDFQDYSDQIVMIVDENGFFKASFPIFQIITKFGDTVELAGSIIFAKNIESEHSTDIGEISEDEIFDLRDNLSIKLLGITRGVK